MPLNLIGLLQASKYAPSAGQSFRNFVAGSPINGTAMNDYVLGSPFTTQNIKGVTQTVGTLSVVSSSYSSAQGPLPAFTNVTVVSSFTAGPKVGAIYDPAYVAADTNRVVVENVGTDLGSVVPGYSYLDVRSSTVDLAAGTITTVCTVNNTDSYEGTLPNPGSGGYKTIQFRVGFQPEPYFNLRAYSGVSDSSGGFQSIYVKPYRQGTPLPIGHPNSAPFSVQIQSPLNTGAFTAEDAAPFNRRRGDFGYNAIINSSNYYHAGYFLRPQVDGSWHSNWSSDYANYSPQITYKWFEALNYGAANEAWVLKSTITASQPVTNPAAAYAVSWDYDLNGNPFPSQIPVRFTAQITSPYISSIGTATLVITPPATQQIVDANGNSGT